MKLAFVFAPLLALSLGTSQAQTIDFEQYNPPSTLKVPQHPVTAARYPFIDIHNHQNSMDEKALQGLVADMDKMNMRVMVNLSGRNGERLAQMTASIHEHYPDRFVVFANIDFTGIGNPGWTEKAVAQLEADEKSGAAGLKIFKNLGFSVQDVNGQRVRVDDERLAPIWEACGRLKLPVLIHTADPAPFWEPMDNNNERLLELKTRPGRKRSDTDPAPWQTLINEQHNIFRKHSNTTFIAAHFGWYANDLQHLDSLLTALPNVVVEFGAIIAELGRQPQQARSFFQKYQDRILFGKDSWVPDEYPTYFRTLETNDEYFPYHKKYHAFWAMYGMGLSDEILRKVYYRNALRIVPKINKKSFAGL